MRLRGCRSGPPWTWYFTEHRLHGETGHALYLLAAGSGSRLEGRRRR
ncbi:hypothetical protein ATKI12_2682 [Kitasatospora sp. Ki12]